MSYVTTIQADTPLHWWRMADGGGLVVHDVGSSPKHAPGGSPELGYSGPAANGGSAIIADPGGYSVRENMPLTDPFSGELWLWITEHVPSAQYALLASDGVTGGVGYYLGLSTNRKLIAFVGASAAINGATALTTQAWHHIVITHDNANVRLYLDGAQDAILAVGAVAGWNLNYGLGQKPNATSRLNFGWISECAHYNGALAPANVLAHFNAAEQITQSPLYTGGGLLDITSALSLAGPLVHDPMLDLIWAAVHRDLP